MPPCKKQWEPEPRPTYNLRYVPQAKPRMRTPTAGTYMVQTLGEREQVWKPFKMEVRGVFSGIQKPLKEGQKEQEDAEEKGEYVEEDNRIVERNEPLKLMQEVGQGTRTCRSIGGNSSSTNL